MRTLSAPEARLLTVQPYDKASIKAIEKAIMESDVGLTPNNDGNLIRLSIPELTEERRAEAELQKLTDSEVKQIDELLKGKEEEILRG